MRAFRLPVEDHSMEHRTRCEASAHDLNHSDVIDIEICRFVRHNDHCGLGDEMRQPGFMSVLL